MRFTVKRIVVATCFVALGGFEQWLVKVSPALALAVAFIAGGAAVLLEIDQERNS